MRIVRGKEPKIIVQKMHQRGDAIIQVSKPGSNRLFAPKPKTLPPHGAKERVASGQIEDPVAAGLSRAKKARKEYLANVDLDRQAIYLYLQVVFDVVQEWRRLGKANEYSLEALKRHHFPIKMKPNPFARLIYCSSEEDDPKKRSKWAKIMRWVAKHNKKGNSFTKFVTKNGGLNECAENAAHDWLPKWP